MNGSFSFGQFHPGNSLLHQLDPRNKIVSAFLLVVVIMLIKDFALLLYFGAGLGLLLLISRISWSDFFNSIKMIFALIIFTMLAHLFFTPGEVIYRLGIIKVTREGLYEGGMMSVKFLYIVATTSLVTMSTSPMAFTDGLLAIFRPLKRIGFPAEEMALMMSIAIRFIPTLWEETDRIRKAQMSRGALFDRGSVLKRIRHMTALMVPILVGAFRRADELALAMESRAFQVGSPRTRLRVLQYSAKDFMVIGFVVLLTISTILYRLGWQVAKI